MQDRELWKRVQDWSEDGMEILKAISKLSQRQLLNLKKEDRSLIEKLALSRSIERYDR